MYSLICAMLVMTILGDTQVCIGVEEEYTRIKTMTVPRQDNNSSDEVQAIAQEVPSIFSDFDLYLFGQGKHYQIYEKMGAHPRTVNGISGINFAVWAPNALAVSVIGDFNGWTRGSQPMNLRHQDLGVWEIFVPGVQVGTLYKYAIYSRYNNYAVDKTDPYGFAQELRPLTASIVTDIRL